MKHRAEKALATDGVERTRLGYNVLVKLKIDDLLEQEDILMPVSGGDGEALRRHPRCLDH